MKSALSLLLAIVFLPAMAGAEPIQRARYLMGTICEIAVDGSADAEAEIEAAFSEAERIESMLSTWTDHSDLSLVNRGAAPASELSALLAEVLDWSRTTEYTFDPRVGRLVEVWKIRGEGAEPEEREIQSALGDRSCWEEGAFGKGYALDRMLGRIDAREAAVNFGGQIAVRGSLTATIADPSNRDKPVVALTLQDESLSTTSGSEKTFMAGGRSRSHIVDPRTGESLPPRGSVSVVEASALSADVLSTALYVMGVEEGLRWADANRIAAIFITERNQIRLSGSARERWRDIELLDRNFTIRN